ncbi:MAG: hypothetical protein PWQ92_1372 [Thermococcaceae archaeon]|nr:hypothetical protein [Thermococcaceae archaeon]
MRREFIGVFLSFLVFGLVLWFFRPWFHGIVMSWEASSH